MEIYTGYIVAEGESNPYSVWIPAKNGSPVFKSFKSFGSNASSFDSTDLSTLKSAAEKCYMINEPTAQSGYLYDENSGMATIEENNYNPDITTIRDVRGRTHSANRFSTPHDGEYVSSPHASPADNGLQTYLPSSAAGTQINTYTNAPSGHHSTLGIGTKVLVVYPDGKGVGYIIGQIPNVDETSTIIKDITG